MDILNLLSWRYAAKAMSGKKVESEKLQNILESIRLAPTSSGLQPFEVLVISNQALKEKIRPIAFDQRQVVECSDLLVFAAWENYTEDRINAVFEHMKSVRGTSEELENYKQMILDMYITRDPEINFIHTARQVYIALGVALLAAANEQVDCTPMEGFDPAALDELLDLRSQGLRSVAILPVGYRDTENDWNVNLVKVRKPMDKLVKNLK